jgi:sec-independent protein translocase protein TatC
MAETDDDDGPPGDKKMPLLDHLVELRSRLIWSIVAFFGAFLVAYGFLKEPIFQFLLQPLAHLPHGDTRRLIFTAPTEAFFTYIKVAFFTALCIAFPVIATQIWRFVAPGLYRNEKDAFLPFIVATPAMFLIGAAFLYYAVLPAALLFFTSFEMPRGEGVLPIQLEAKMGEYLSFVMTLIFAFGLSFQLPVLLTLLAKVGLITAEQLRSNRRYAIVGCLAFAGVVTPPDAFSMIALGIPLYGLYEVSIWLAKVVAPKPDEDDEEAAAPAKPGSGAAAPAPARATIFEENDFHLAR